MDLGLDRLTDDQLFDLLQEVLSNLAARDGYVRRMAQEAIISRAQALEIARREFENLMLDERQCQTEMIISAVQKAFDDWVRGKRILSEQDMESIRQRALDVCIVAQEAKEQKELELSLIRDLKGDILYRLSVALGLDCTATVESALLGNQITILITADKERTLPALDRFSITYVRKHEVSKWYPNLPIQSWPKGSIIRTNYGPNSICPAFSNLVISSLLDMYSETDFAKNKSITLPIRLKVEGTSNARR